MIDKPNSLTLMNDIDTVIHDSKEIKNELALLESQIETKLDIINTYYTVMGNMMNPVLNLTGKTRPKNRIVFALEPDKIKEKECELYGQVVHPKRIGGLSSQVFNYLTNSGPLFKDNATVTFIYKETEDEDAIEDSKSQYCDILKDENDPSKKDVFCSKFPTQKICLRIETKPGNLIGNSYFNMIEICPYLPGTFSIDAVRIWTIDQYLANGGTIDDMVLAEQELPVSDDGPYIEHAGTERFCLDKDYQLYRIEFDITIHEAIENGYPFGLRHIYFYRAHMDTENSYLVAELKTDGYIDTIGEKVRVVTPHGIERLYGAEFYASFENGILQGRLSQTGHIARNLESCYIKIPVKQPIRAIIFDEIETR